MRVLFNKKFLDHNKDEKTAEGSYRLQEFPEHFDDEDVDGEPYMTLVHPNLCRLYKRIVVTQIKYWLKFIYHLKAGKQQKRR